MAFHGSNGNHGNDFNKTSHEDDGSCGGCRLVAHNCCVCISLQSGSMLIGLVGIVASIVLLILQMINGFFVAIILSAVAIILLSILLVAGAMFERPSLLVGYIVVVGLALLFTVGYFIYYLYALAISPIAIAAYIPILMFIVLGK